MGNGRGASLPWREQQAGETPAHPDIARLSRRELAMLGAAGLAGAWSGRALADHDAGRFVAHPPPGFTPLTTPGKVVKVTKGNDIGSLMQPNQTWPKPDVARLMFERAMTELTGASSAAEAMKKLVHPADIVAIKVNGIAGQAMATNFELLLPIVQAVLDAGVPAPQVTVYEQYPNFLSGTRINLSGNRLPDGVSARFHSNSIATMPEIRVYENVPTKYVKHLTDATAVINVSLIKDHSICGYTGALKNITHGSIINPHDHHAHHASPQIAVLFNHPIVRSRMRLHITDGFKLIYDQGPLDKNPSRRVFHGAVYATTDPVAMDVIGWHVVDEARKQNGMKPLAEVGRNPAYIHAAAELGLGTGDRNAIRLREIAL
jgi:uncharacterized protein (DUF362 family)